MEKMKKLTAFFVSLSLTLLLSAPLAVASDGHSGELPPPPPDGGGSSVRLSKGNLVFYELLSFVLSLDGIRPII